MKGNDKEASRGSWTAVSVLATPEVLPAWNLKTPILSLWTFTPNATTPGWEQVQDSGWLNLFNRWQNGPQRWRGEFKHHGKWIYLPQIYSYPITSSSISRIECVLAKAPLGHYRKEHRMMVINQKSPKREFNNKSQGLSLQGLLFVLAAVCCCFHPTSLLLPSAVRTVNRLHGRCWWEHWMQGRVWD